MVGAATVVVVVVVIVGMVAGLAELEQSLAGLEQSLAELEQSSTGLGERAYTAGRALLFPHCLCRTAPLAGDAAAVEPAGGAAGSCPRST